MSKVYLLLSSLVILFMPALSSCDDDADTFYFIGDSQIQRWDLQASFPTLSTENDGLSGSRVDYIERHAGQYTGKNVVMLSGTNNMWQEVDADGLAAQIFQAAKSLEASRLYIISVLPRGGEEGRRLNEKTIRFNSRLKTLIKAESNPSIIFIDTYNLLTDNSGMLNPEYTYDNLHLNFIGYEVLTHEVAKFIL